jgi:hypothetical protein
LPEAGLKVECVVSHSEITPLECLRPARIPLLPSYGAKGTSSNVKDGGRRLDEKSIADSDLDAHLVKEHPIQGD